MGNITQAGLDELGYTFSEVHGNAAKMASVAASTYKLFGFESAVVPFDVGLEAEALGCAMNFYEGREGIIYPTVKSKIYGVERKIALPENLAGRGRVPVVSQAIAMLRDEVGGELAVGSYVLGPFTLAGQVMDLNELLKASFKEQGKVAEILDALANAVIAIARALRDSGADFITIREMGASSDVISPRMFQSLVLPHLKKAVDGIPRPRILHICGNTEPILEHMQRAGADAISVEQRCDIARARAKLGKEAIILGNIDPYKVLVNGSPDDVARAVKKVIDDGVSGVMPGCDIWPAVPRENMVALVKATREYGIKR